MIDKQLTIRELIKSIGKQRCVSCRGDMDISTVWKIPLCKKCREEIKEDLAEIGEK